MIRRSTTKEVQIHTTIRFGSGYTSVVNTTPLVAQITGVRYRSTIFASIVFIASSFRSVQSIIQTSVHILPLYDQTKSRQTVDTLIGH